MKIKELMNCENLNVTQLSQILDNSQSKIKLNVDFWGSRILTIDGFSLKLDDLAQRIFRVGDKVFSENLSSQERWNGAFCVKKLRTYYKETDSMINKLNCVSSFILKFKLFFNLGEGKKSFNVLTGFNESAREKTTSYENFRGFLAQHFRDTFPGTSLPDTHLNDSRGTLYYYKGNQMPPADDFCIF
jgi:hypothetical protein